MEQYHIAKEEYFLYNTIKIECPYLVRGCRNIATFIDKHNIPDDAVIYARSKGGKWIVTDGKGKSVDKFFVLASWFTESFLDDGSDDAEEAEESSDDREHTFANSQLSTKYARGAHGKLPLVPVRMAIDPTEMFFRADGSKMEIDVRGSREYGECFFLAKDVAREFGIPDLTRTILHKDRGYLEGEDYCYFNNPNAASELAATAQGERIQTKNIYITYSGLMHVVMRSRSMEAISHRTRAIKTLFAGHLGSVESRTQLASEITGLPIVMIKQMTNATAGNLPCVYLYELGSVLQLRESMGIDAKYPDRDRVYKWGYTNNLSRRTGEHIREYAEIDGVVLKLEYQAYVDDQYVAQAEKEVRVMFANLKYKLKYKKYQELVVIPSKNLSKIKEEYGAIGKKYLVRVRDLVQEKSEMASTHLQSIEDMQRDFDLKIRETEARHQLEIVELQHALECKELEAANMITQKELENKDLRLQLLQEKYDNK